MGKWILAAALLAAACAAPVQAQNNRHNNDVALDWPLPWRAGVTLTYDETSESSKRKGDKVERSSATATTRVSIVHADEAGFLQRWQWGEADYRFDGVDPTEQAVYRSLAAALQDVPLDVRLDREGAFLSIANVGQFQPALREVLGKTMREAGAARATQVSAEEKGTIERGLAAMLDTVTSEAFVSAMLSKQPQAFNFMGAGGLVVDQLVEYEDQGQNPTGGAPFPMLGTILVSHVADAPGFVEAHWTVKLHPVKSVPVIADSVGKLFGDALPAGTDAAVRKALPKTIDIGSDTTYLIDTATGIVHRMVRTERKNIADRQETETTTLRLRQPPGG